MRTKNFDLDDIGFIGGGPPPTEEDFRAISAFIQARKAKHAATCKAVANRSAKGSPTKRATKTKARA